MAVAWWVLLAVRGLLPACFAVATGVLVGAVERGSGLAAPLLVGGRRVRALPGAHAAAHRDQRRPRQPDRGLALRRADRRRASRRRASRTSRTPTSSPTSRRARLRPRHHRAAAVDQHGLHRERPGRDGRRARLGAAALRLRLVGGAGAHRRVGLDALSAARERGVAGPQHRRGAAARSATPTTRTGSRSTRRRPRRCGCSGSSDWVIERFTSRRRRLLRAPVAVDPAARAPARPQPR